MTVRHQEANGVVLTFGIFDGVHLGHQLIINQVISQAKLLQTKSMVLTFEPHPAQIISGSAPPLITTTDKKIEIIKSMGVDIVKVEKFNEALSMLPPEDFVKDILIDKLHAQVIVAGYDCAFGAKRSGDKRLLKELGKKYNCDVQIVPPYVLEGEIVSSTRIRKAIAEGDLELVKRLLGRAYSIEGKVVPGKGIGKKIGYATANLSLPNLALPPNGVYAVKALLRGTLHNGILNMGVQPTFQSGQFQVEVHLFNVNETLYDERLEVFFIRKIRDELCFQSVEELVRQIEKDMSIAQKIIDGEKD